MMFTLGMRCAQAVRYRTLAVAVLGLGLALGPAPGVRGADQAAVGQVTALAGQGVIFHAALREPQDLKVQDGVFLRDRIETREQSVVRVLLGGKATVTVRELSTLTITEDPTRSTVELHGGKLALQVNKAMMQPGDEVRILTPNAIIGIRGSLVVAEVTGDAAAPQSKVTALEASLPILVALRSSPGKTTPLLPHHAVTVSGPRHAARVGRVQRISVEHARKEAETADVPSHHPESPQKSEHRLSEERSGSGHEPRAAGRPIGLAGRRR
jgi:hypothetical protein